MDMPRRRLPVAALPPARAAEGAAVALRGGAAPSLKNRPPPQPRQGGGLERGAARMPQARARRETT